MRDFFVVCQVKPHNADDIGRCEGWAAPRSLEPGKVSECRPIAATLLSNSLTKNEGLFCCMSSLSLTPMMIMEITLLSKSLIFGEGLFVVVILHIMPSSTLRDKFPTFFPKYR